MDKRQWENEKYVKTRNQENKRIKTWEISGIKYQKMREIRNDEIRKWDFF